VAHVVEHRYHVTLQPLHAVFLAGTVPLFLGALLSDAAYAKTFHIQWSNFASWLIAGALVFAGIALVFALVDLFRPYQRARGSVPYFVVLLATWILGFINALWHARDAWAVMPLGLILSIVVTLLACLACWLGFRTPRVMGPL
jgi:uncharacterized membrane protein